MKSFRVPTFGFVLTYALVVFATVISLPIILVGIVARVAWVSFMWGWSLAGLALKTPQEMANERLSAEKNK